jgi:transcriptional regulator GlxA family with amidase domain
VKRLEEGPQVISACRSCGVSSKRWNEAEGKPLYLTELCAAIGVSERTLHLHYLEQLGIAPHRYLMLRRMNLVRQALTRANPAITTVTAIATEHEFWELGRFAVAYRKLFSEPPSVTLGRVT